MVKFIPWEQILTRLVKEQKLIPTLAEILQGIHNAHSARWSHIARHMRGHYAAAYKRLQRLVASFDPRPVLARLCLDEAPFVLLDPTAMPRPQARKTAYVGRLPEGQRGFWLLVLSTPFRGRALPCGWLTYSSTTIAEEGSSQPQEVRRLLETLHALLRGRPLVADRGFHDRKFFAWLQQGGIPFIIRVKMRPHPLKLYDEAGNPLRPVLQPGESRAWLQVRHHELTGLTLIGYWKQGHAKPLWLLTTWPDAEQALKWYLQRMKIEESFRDIKSLLGVTENMNRQRLWMERTMGLVLLAYAIGYLAGELLRDIAWGNEPPPERIDDWHKPQQPRRAWYRYSGLFTLLRAQPPLSRAQRRRWRRLLSQLPALFPHPLVQTHV